mmetsp:Transcript_88661/g.264490  ORF Transcript_88661/g.264490 Transcript_88661/m.264490 type:complete len:299 (+) Transcript_88661:67-963(+)
MALPGMEAMAPVGEWPGATSGRFVNSFTGKPAGRRIVETGARNGAEHGIAQRGFAGYFSDTAGLIPTQGKRCDGLGPRGSEDLEWKPARRCLSEPGCQHPERPEGRRIVDKAPPRKVVSLREKRHIRQVSSREEIGDLPCGPKTVVRENGLRALDQPAREVDLCAELQRKGRPTDLYSQRNGLGCRALGDKAFRHPEYDRGFYQAGGLVAGSTFLRGTHKKTEPRNGATVALVLNETRRPLKSYAESQRELRLQEEQAEVQALTRSWEASQAQTFKEIDPDYEALSDSEDEGQEQEAA